MLSRYCVGKHDHIKLGYGNLFASCCLHQLLMQGVPSIIMKWPAAGFPCLRIPSWLTPKAARPVGILYRPARRRQLGFKINVRNETVPARPAHCFLSSDDHPATGGSHILLACRQQLQAVLGYGFLVALVFHGPTNTSRVLIEFRPTA